MSLTFTAIDHSFGDQSVLRDVSLTARRGEILCLLGPSGSGKTTLLRLAAGLEVLHSGRIALDERVLADTDTHVPPEQRSVGLVFQDHVLYPHLNVAENIAFGLSQRPLSEQRLIVEQQLAAVDLAGLGERYPHTLSGGQQQRVALARALAPEPDVMLLDEPFASVDAGLRRRLREQARLSLKASNAITLVVTHDAEEAMEFGDCIAYLSQGRLVQVGTPSELWRAPTDAAVALALGDAQSLPADADHGILHTAYGEIPLGQVSAQQLHPGQSCALVVRPNSVSVESCDEADAADACIEDVRFLGDGYLLLLRSRIDPEAPLLRVQTADLSANSVTLTTGGWVKLTFHPAGAFAFSASA